MAVEGSKFYRKSDDGGGVLTLECIAQVSQKIWQLAGDELEFMEE